MVNNNNNLILTDSRPTRADAVKNREILLETASRLFEQHGVEMVSMTQIAQEAGVGKGTLYRHFSSKNELCHALLDQEMRELQETTLLRLRTPHDPEGILCWFLEEIAAFVDRNNELLRTESEQVSALEFPAHLWWRQTIRGLLARLGVGGDLDYAADVFYVLLDAQTIYFQRQSLGYDRQRILDGLHATLSRFVGD
ncbi:MAG: TetR/AcrR family transcriptional regulator [Anaerolineae bacterium]